MWRANCFHFQPKKIIGSPIVSHSSGSENQFRRKMRRLPRMAASGVLSFSTTSAGANQITVNGMRWKTTLTAANHGDNPSNITYPSKGCMGAK